MSAQPCDAPAPAAQPEPYEVIHLGGEAAAIVPLAEIRRLRALERAATGEELAEAEEAVAYEDWQEREAAGLTVYVSAAEARQRLGLEK